MVDAARRDAGAVAGGLALLLLMLPVAGAQDGSLPDEANDTLWLHIKNSPRSYWINALANDPAHDSTGAGYNALGFVLTEAGVAAWNIPMQPALAGPVPLLDGGTVDFTLYIGGGSAAGRVAVTAELRLGSTAVASASWSAFQYANAYTELKQSVAPTAQALDPTVGDLSLVIRASGAGAQIFLGAGGSTWSHVVLPVAPGAPAADFRTHNLTGAAATFSLAPSTPANATHVYAWATDASPLELTLTGNRSAGNATIRITDGANATAFDGVFDGNATTTTLTGAAGNWSIRVDLDAFAGNLTFRLGPPAATGTATASGSASSGPSATGGAGTTQGSGNQTGTGEGDGDGDKDTPGTALPLLLALVALAAVVRRRL